nr:hypothetical protein [Tanacetum cinerariifolium]
MFRINSSKTSKEEKQVPNTVSACARTKPITVSQHSVITKKDTNSDLNGLSSTGVDNTKTKRPQPRINTKNDRVPSASKSSRNKNKDAEVEEHHRNLLSKNNKRISSACNNSKFDSQDVISKVVCAMCKKCLISVNHDKCLSNYVSGKNSYGKNHKANVSKNETQPKNQPEIKKPKKVGFIRRLVTPKPRFLLRWSPTGKMFDQDGKLVVPSNSESHVDCSNGDNACTSNAMEPKIKWFPNSTSLLGRNDHVAAILGFDDLQWGNILITRVYFVEGLGHNLFSVGQFYDSDLEHQRLSHLNFDTINDLAKNDLVAGLPKFKYHKEHLCPSCEQGKSKRASHPPKLVPNSRQRLHLLHMDLCGPMRIASINGKRYVLVIVDDYSRYTWVLFLISKDEAPAVIITFLKRIMVLLQISPDKVSREAKKVPNTVSTSSRTKPITVSQPSVITKKDMNSNLNGLSSTGLDNTKTRRPKPRSNTKNDRVPSASKISRSKNKEVKVEEHHRNLLLSKKNKHISSACNNSKIDSQDVISKSRGRKHKANVSTNETQQKNQPGIKKPKKVGFIRRLATPKPRKPRFLLRWSPTGKIFDQDGKLVVPSNSESHVDCSNGCSKHMTGNLKLLINFVWKFMGTVRFGNDHVAAILGFGDLQNLEGVDLLKGDHLTNLYTINVHEMGSASPICLMARASSTKSWLWHQRLSHLNFDTINDLARNDLVVGLPKFKYHKEHLCPSCEQGKRKRASHPLKPVPNSRQILHLLHMDLCGPMRIASINGKRYILVIVDDYSRYTWVHFLRSKNEAPVVIITFLKRITILL